MTEKRIILELGTGNDLYGEDYTKAAIRAVQDAMHHSSLVLLRSLEIDPESMLVDVTIGCQRPQNVDTDAVARQIPYGRVTVTARRGGLDVADEDNGLTTAIAVAAIAVRLDLPDGPYRLN